MTRSSLIVIVVAVVFAAFIVRTARNKRTSERHTFAWLLVCAAMIALAIWRDGIDEIAHAMGIYYAPSALFFAVSAGLLWLVYRQSLELADQRQKVKRLAQELALLTASGKQSPPGDQSP